jgi:hypothetical protein
MSTVQLRRRADVRSIDGADGNSMENKKQRVISNGDHERS